MKGEMIMNRFRLLLFTLFVATLTALSTGIGVTYAQQDQVATQAQDPAAAQAQDPAAAQRKAAAAVRARAKRDAAIKKKQDAKKYIQKVIEGQQSGAAATAPGNAGSGGAQ
jgi:uncharacterized protein HemX